MTSGALGLTVANFPAGRVVITLESGEKIFIYMKHLNSIQTKMNIVASREIKIRREYNIKEIDSNNYNDIEWAEKTSDGHLPTVKDVTGMNGNQLRRKASKDKKIGSLAKALSETNGNR